MKTIVAGLLQVKGRRKLVVIAAGGNLSKRVDRQVLEEEGSRGMRAKVGESEQKRDIEERA